MPRHRRNVDSDFGNVVAEVAIDGADARHK
jgi:hypothetical protein